MISKNGISFLKLCNRTLNLSRGRASEYCCVLSSKICTSCALNEKTINYSRNNNFKNKFLDKENPKFEDTFGNLDSFDRNFMEFPEDPEDVREYERSKQAQGKTILQYMREIKHHIQNHDYKSALRVLEVDMVNDRKPTVSHIYDILVSYNAEIGDLKEAYRVYTEFKKRQGRVNGGMYTSLFNACANCKNSSFALEKADAIREFLYKDKTHTPNITNYNAMLKAYGRHGDIPTCLKIFDEVVEKKDKVRAETYCFLLQACISDKNSGLRHALIVWRRMLQNRVTPTIYSFNLLLRCVRECSFGEKQLINDVAEQIMRESKKFFKKKVIYKLEDGVKKRKVLKLEVTKSELISNNQENGKESLETETPRIVKTESENGGDKSEIVEVKESEEISYPETVHLDKEAKYPNFIALNPTVGSVVNFEVMTKPHERFLTLGGVDGFLNVMSEFEVKPDRKTFSLLLDVIPSTAEAEEEILSKAKEFGVKLETCFFNILIKRRNKREDYDLVEDALKMMQERNVQPDIITFGVLSIGCNTYEKGVQLIESATNYGIRLNTVILGALLVNAYKLEDLNYVKAILKAAKEHETTLNQKFVHLLGKIVEQEKKKRLSQGNVQNQVESF